MIYYYVCNCSMTILLVSRHNITEKEKDADEGGGQGWPDCPPLDRLGEGGVEDVDRHQAGVTKGRQGPGQPAGVVTLVLQAGFVQGQVTEVQGSL